MDTLSSLNKRAPGLGLMVDMDLSGASLVSTKPILPSPLRTKIGLSIPTPKIAFGRTIFMEKLKVGFCPLVPCVFARATRAGGPTLDRAASYC